MSEPKFGVLSLGVSFDLPTTLAKIYDSPEYAAAARLAGKAAGQFRHDVELELKALVGEARKEARAELAAFEKELSEQALVHALGKFRSDVEHSLKQIYGKHRDDALAAHEEPLAKAALKAAKAKVA
jgi:hypothetical protein